MRYLVWTVLAGGLVFAGAGTSWADDTVRLGGPSAEAAIQGGTNTDLVRWGWGHRGYYGGYRGYYGGYRGYYGGYYGYYRPYYYRPYYYGRYYYTPYYYSPYNYYTPSYYYGCSSMTPIAATAPTNGTIVQATNQSYVETLPAPLVGTRVASQPSGTNNVEVLAPPVYNGGGNGTFPYNGGPANPIPMPGGNNIVPMQNAPRGTVPLEGKLVSLPTETTGGVSTIASRTFMPTNFVSTNTVPANPPVRIEAPKRIVYPAYGE